MFWLFLSFVVLHKIRKILILYLFYVFIFSNFRIEKLNKPVLNKSEKTLLNVFILEMIAFFLLVRF